MPIPPARPLGAPRRPFRRGSRGLVPARSGRRGAVLLAVAGLAGGLLTGVAGPAAADPTPPPYVSDGQIGAAQATKTQLATQVGSLTAQLTVLQNQVQALQAASELAEQKYAYAAQQLDDAETAATQAKADVATAQAAVEQARAAFNASVRANYTQGAGVQGGAGALLASDDPDEILQAAATQRYVTSHQADGIGQLDRATVAKANADARARTAVATRTQLAAAAQTAYEDAQASQAAAQSQQATLATQTAGVQAQLDTAQATLLGLQNQRAAYDAWKAEQIRLAQEAEAARQAQAAAAAVAAQAAAAKALAASGGSRPASSSASSGSGGSGSAGGTGGSPSGGAWSVAKGQEAVNRAMQWIGTPYAWNGGNSSGPTYGQCVAGAARNDCHIKGFDCSGLVLYGWAPFMAMPHYTVAMWSQMAGSYHPRTGDLMPGDLLFYGGSASTIHHVAMYIGGGNVVQAPQSGDHVRVTPLYAMGSDYYGAVRPMS